MLVLPTSTWKGTVAFQRVIKATTVLGMQQKLPAQALAGSSGTPSSHMIAPHAAHPLQRGERAVELGEVARPSALTRPFCTCTGLAQLPCGHCSAPLRVWRTPESLICRHDEVPKQPSEMAWEQVNGNAKLFILKCCRCWNGALVRSNWKMCPLLFNFRMSLLQLTECKEGNLQTNHLMSLVGIFWGHCNIWRALADAFLTLVKCRVSMQMQSWHTQ